MRKRVRLMLIILGIILVIGISGAIAGNIMMARIEDNLKALTEKPIFDPNLKALKDGDYHGSANFFPIEVEVNVQVTDSRITGIDLVKHRNGRGKDAESIPHKVIQAQSLQVEAVSGATYSSKAILLAIADALSYGVCELK